MTGSIPAPAAADGSLAAASAASPRAVASRTAIREPILEIHDLRTQFDTDAGVVRAVDGVSLSVMPGETLGIVGESGSGKSVTALSIIKLLQEQSRIAGGAITFRGQNIVTMSKDGVRALRGDKIAMVFQDPMTSLNPVLRISDQLVEAIVVHGKRDQKSARAHAIQLLRRMGLTEPERAINGFPHQFSGGMRQRVMLAMGFANEPSLLIADEPTTALDVTIQAQILDLLRELNADFGTAIILISHDLGVIANVCQRIVVMYAGEVVEEGPAEALLSDPRHPYTWALLNAAPRLDSERGGDKRLITIEGTPPDPLSWPSGCRFAERCPFRVEACAGHPELKAVGARRQTRCWVTQGGSMLPSRQLARKTEGSVVPSAEMAARSLTPEPSSTSEPILEVKNLIKHFPVPKDGLFGKQQAIHAVDGVDLAVMKGETVGLVGESGCGKSTLARLIARIHRPDAGLIRFAGHDITFASSAEIRPLRRRLQMIFQDPYASLNPRMTIADILSEPLRFHGLTAGESDTHSRVEELLALVGLTRSALEKFPHEFSGGQRQRISIARALAVSPEMIIADEPISSLDVNIQAQIINLLLDLQQRLGLTYLFIAHDLAVVRHISDRIVVLYLGQVMEIARAGELFVAPLHPYTRSLISAVPVPDATVERARQRIMLTGEPPSALSPPSGCRFRTRCPLSQARCAKEAPTLVEHRPGQWAACHFPG